MHVARRKKVKDQRSTNRTERIEMAEQSNVDGRPRKRGRYNTHRRDISVGKPKSTRYRHDKTVKFTTAEYEEDIPKETGNVLLIEREANYSEEFVCAADDNTHFDLSDMSSSSSPNHEEVNYITTVFHVQKNFIHGKNPNPHFGGINVPVVFF